MKNTARNPFRAEHGALIYVFSIFALLALQLVCALFLAPFYQKSGYGAAANFAGIILQGGNTLVLVLLLRKLNTRPDIYLPIDRTLTTKPYLRLKLTPTLITGIVMGALCGLLCLLSFYPITTLWSQLLKKIGYTSDGGVYLNTPMQIILAFVGAAVLAPVLEELIYRSALLSGLKKSGKNRYTAAFISAAAFMLMHMNPEQTVYQLFLGFACALLALSTGSVLPAIAAHFVSNLTVLLAGTTPFGKLFDLYDKILDKNAAVIILLTLALTAEGGGAIYFICKLLKNKTDQAEQGEKTEKVMAKGKIKPNSSKDNDVIATVRVDYSDKTKDVPDDDVIVTVRVDSSDTYGKNSYGNSYDQTTKAGFNLKRLTLTTKLLLLGMGISAIMWIAVLIQGL